MSKSKQLTYKNAGVDIDAGDALVDRIKPFAKATNRKGNMGGLGGFGALFDLKAAGKYKDPILVSSTDGVGTKLKIAQEVGKHDTIGIDLVAMCVNDLVVQGAEPLFFLDYFATGKLSVDDAAQVIKGIAAGCKQAGCALVGGETAEMPGMYKPGEYDLAGFSVGVVERKKILPKKNVKTGDVVLGLASSGVHSNGFSLVRYIMEEAGFSYAMPAPFERGKTMGEALLTPTRIYVKTCLELMKKFPSDVKAFAHITGGGIVENLPRVLPKDIALDGREAAWDVPSVFLWLHEMGVPMNDLLRTFNCGIGMAMVVSKSSAPKVVKFLQSKKEEVFLLGELVKRKKGQPQVIVG